MSSDDLMDLFDEEEEPSKPKKKATKKKEVPEPEEEENICVSCGKICITLTATNKCCICNLVPLTKCCTNCTTRAELAVEDTTKNLDKLKEKTLEKGALISKEKYLTMTDTEIKNHFEGLKDEESYLIEDKCMSCGKDTYVCSGTGSCKECDYPTPKPKKEAKNNSLDDLFADAPSKPKPEDKTKDAAEELKEFKKKVPPFEEKEYVAPKETTVLPFDEDVVDQLQKQGFTFEEDEGDDKTTIVFYGRKGEGKTYATFKLPGNIACISLDDKAKKIKDLFHAKDKRIKIYNAMKFYRESPEKEQVRTGKKTFDYVIFMLEEIAKQKVKPDWIVIDGLEILHRMCELDMRYQKGLLPYQGFKELVWWRIRRDNLALIHRLAYGLSNKGVAYTTYLKKERIADEVDDTEIADDVPKWVGVIMEKTDVVFKCFKKWIKQQMIFRVTIESSKEERFPSGRILNVTDSSVHEQLGIEL